MIGVEFDPQRVIAWLAGAKFLAEFFRHTLRCAGFAGGNRPAIDSFNHEVDQLRAIFGFGDQLLGTVVEDTFDL